MKRTITSLIVGLVVAGIIFAGYYFGSRKETGAPVAEENPTGGLPQAPGNLIFSSSTASPTGISNPSALNFGVISSVPVVDYFVDKDNNVFAIQTDGEVIEVTKGQTKVLSSSTISEISSASFSFDGKKIFAASGARGNLSLSVFDAASSSWKNLASGIQSPAWSPNSHKLVYTSESGAIANLKVIDLDGRKPAAQMIFSFHEEDLAVDWVYPDEIFLKDKTSAFYAGSIWALDLKTKTLNPVVLEMLGAQAKWDTITKEGIVFAGNRSNKGGVLSLVDDRGQVIHQLSFLTLPEKCAFDENAANASSVSRSFYCAAPSDPFKMNTSPLPDAYEQKQFFTADAILKINLSDGSLRPIFTSDAYPLDAINPKVFNGRLFFINRIDQKIYAIGLTTT